MEIVYREDGSKLSETPYVYDNKHGTAIVFDWDGSKSAEIVFENGEEISRKKFYYGHYPDGSKKYESPYVDGKEHGTAIIYRADGSKQAEILWVEGKEHGTQITYRKDGSKRTERIFENGKFISFKEF